MTDHLARAKDYIAKGESFYAKAAAEIVAAMEQDPTLSYREIDRRVGKEARKGKWSSELVQWHTSAHDVRTPTPYGGEEKNKARTDSTTKKTLRDADADKLDELVSALDRDQQTALERAIKKALQPAAVKKGAKQRKDVARWASDGAMAWFSVAEQLVNEGVSIPEGANRETLKRSLQATRTMLDAVDRVLNEEITVEEFAAALDDRDAVREFLSA